MRTMVCFRAGDGSFAIPVESTTGVRTSAGMTSLPGSNAEVVGVLPGDPPLTVLSTLGAGRDHVLVLCVDGVSFGLLVQEVIGVLGIDDTHMGPAPLGQHQGLVAGTLRRSDELVLLADARALSSRL